MFHHGFRTRCPIALTLFSSLLLLTSACGDDGDSTADLGEGCSNDAQCKGDRICVENQCVDPDDPPPDRDGGAAGSQGEAGRSPGNDGGAPPRAGSGATAGTNASQAGRPPVIDDPELERACSLNCEARHAAGCSMNIGSLDQCMGQCLIIDEANWGYCLEEQTAQYACLASGGYTCVSGYPQQKATCISESQALAQCSQRTPCRRYCDQRATACGDSAEDCETDCNEKQSSFQDAICGVYYTQLVSCWGQGITCEDGMPAVGNCGPAVAEVADCIGRRNHECDGFCWAAETMGCGSESCVTDCKAKADETACGSYYGRILDCANGSHALQMTCEDGVPTPGTQCMSYITDYESCLARQSQ